MYKVGIVILNWNSFDDSESLMLSLIGQPITIYLADNGSIDTSLLLLKEKFKHYDNVSFIENGSNLGFAAGCNRALKAAYDDGCEVMILMNNDCRIYSIDFTYIQKRLSEDKTIGIMGGKILNWPDTNKIWSVGGSVDSLGNIKYFGYGKVDTGQYDLENERSFISGAFMCIPRRSIERIGYLSEAYFFGKEDWEYCLRLRQSGAKLIYDPRLILYHDAHGSHHPNRTDYLYLGMLSKIIFVKRNNSFIVSSLWLLAFGVYSLIISSGGFGYLFSKILKRNVDQKIVRRAYFPAIIDSFKTNHTDESTLKNFREKYEIC
ncbi:glycosyltransferase family 2 protein [Deinococcus fonticola]|uniref:glycosyltransferase family 2 protein n=1 Tax=Deinococcus fonticola TaxID=2528713 RepID=UPI001F0F0528|nr:glycosyltransferase family 2 protein [Deinococcus fonticola]